MPTDVDPKQAGFVRDWIDKRAAAVGHVVTVYPEGATFEHGWLHVPVSVDDDRDAYDHAQVLEQIENDWNSNPPIDDLLVFLVPAKRSETLKEDLYHSVSVLLTRQKELLGKLAKSSQIDNGADKLLEFQQELESNLRQLEALFPSTRSVV
jgi:hypothetical protein